MNQDNQDREINGMLEALKEFNLKEGLLLTYNQDDHFEIKDKKIIVRPVWKWLFGEEVTCYPNLPKK